MTIHNRGLDGKRRVHPDCKASTHRGANCSCEYLWQGMQADDFGPMAAVEKKRAMRRQPTPVLAPRAPDSDERPDETGDVWDSPVAKNMVREFEASNMPSVQRSKLELAGFWNEAHALEEQPVLAAAPDQIAAFNDIQAKWGSEFAHAWLSNVWHGYRLTRTHEQFCWLKSRDYL